MGIGDWGLEIGEWGLGAMPNTQTPIPKTHKKVKEDKNAIDNKEKNKKEDNEKDLEALKAKYGKELDEYKEEMRSRK